MNAAGRQAAQFVARDMRQDLRIAGLPRTATQADVWRLLRRLKVQNVNRVYLHYNRFKPTGAAFAALDSAAAVRPALEQLRGAHLSAFPLSARAHTLEEPARVRGVAGREEAVRRGLVTGTGADAGIGERGSSVLLSGLPARWFYGDVRRALCDGFDLREAGDATIVNATPAHTRSPAVTSRWLVRLASVSEAHRFVRKVHRTLVHEQRDYQIHAQVVY
ncbi:hypothetical protein AURDEDRAFT_157540 [Auricularia subglabra TFB-10046 SS5]|nr:hypothetical protein AURDEDRAFT_157540 [Auricularia subglabra TFB-10046 SS5]